MQGAFRSAAAQEVEELKAALTQQRDGNARLECQKQLLLKQVELRLFLKQLAMSRNSQCVSSRLPRQKRVAPSCALSFLHDMAEICRLDVCASYEYEQIFPCRS